MDTLVVILPIFPVMFIVPWLIEKFAKPNETIEQTNDSTHPHGVDQGDGALE
jgi:hypothetical protein